MRQSLVVAGACCAICFLLTATASAQTFSFVDLQPQANQKLKESLGSGADGNTLEELPAGEQTFCGIKFKVGERLIHLGSQMLEEKPNKVEGIQVNQTFDKLHFLHATCFGGGPNKEDSPGFVKDGKIIGAYKVHFEDKSIEVIPIVYGQDVRDWFYVEGEKEVSRGKVAWRGDNEFAKEVGARIRVYATSWTNPKPDRKVASIDYLSRKDESPAAPFCLAMTLETK